MSVEIAGDEFCNARRVTDVNEAVVIGEDPAAGIVLPLQPGNPAPFALDSAGLIVLIL